MPPPPASPAQDEIPILHPDDTRVVTVAVPRLISDVGPYPQEPLSGAMPVRKRVFDVVFAAASAVLWVPATALAALAILVADGRPIFYRSRRRVFRDESAIVVKLRTMVRGADKIANRETIAVSDQRFLNIPPDSQLYTPIGRLIERFHLTEIPQFAHVLSGRMSLIGSRPLPENVIESLREKFPAVEARFAQRCGMTGPIQLIGRASIPDATRLDLESAYCRVCETRYSMCLDLTILAQTVLVALRLRPGLSVEEVRRLLDRGAR